MNYDQIQWEIGGASDGYSNGDPMFSFELPGSAVNGTLLDSHPVTGLIYHRMNSSVAGRYLFNVRNGAVTSGVPEPGTVALLIAGAGSGVLRRKRKSA